MYLVLIILFFFLEKVMPNEKLQAKSMFESKLLENERASMTKLVVQEINAVDVEHAPAPAMYWSCPPVFGTKPPKMRAHSSVVFQDKMFVFGGTSKTLCSDILYILELGNLYTVYPYTKKEKKN